MSSASAIAASAIASGVRDSVRMEPRVTGPPRTGSSWTRGSRHGASPAPARIEVPAATPRTDVPAGPAFARGLGADVVRSAAAAAASSAASMSSRVCWTGTSGSGAGGAIEVRAVSPARAAAGCRCRRGLRRLGRSRVRLPSAAAAAVAAPVASASAPGPSESSYSPTEPKTGRPAEAARARVAASGAMIESRFSWVSASRASNRKLIRDVATRDPCGSTTADAATLDRPDARRRRRDLVVDVEVDDAAGHGQTFIARRTRRSAASSASSVVWSSIAW